MVEYHKFVAQNHIFHLVYTRPCQQSAATIKADASNNLQIQSVTLEGSDAHTKKLYLQQNRVMLLFIRILSLIFLFSTAGLCSTIFFHQLLKLSLVGDIKYKRHLIHIFYAKEAFIISIFAPQANERKTCPFTDGVD